MQHPPNIYDVLYRTLTEIRWLWWFPARCLEGAHAVPIDEVGTDEAVFAVDAYLVPSIDFAGPVLIALNDGLLHGQKHCF